MGPAEVDVVAVAGPPSCVADAVAAVDVVAEHHSEASLDLGSDGQHLGSWRCTVAAAADAASGPASLAAAPN